MRTPLSQRPRTLEWNLTSMIDVVFLLVIFFLVTSHFSQTERGAEVTLPTAQQALQDKQPDRITITVSAEGLYSVMGEPISLTEVEQRISEAAAINRDAIAVRIRGDRAAHYRDIEPILLACARSGITHFGFHVLRD